jgi:hypothetical protein
MNTEALFIFLILLLGLLLCSFLGGNCGKESFSGNFSGTFNVNESGQTKDSSTTSTSTPSKSFSTNYDNYNHYAGSSSQLTSGSTYYGPSGVTAKVATDSNGSQSLQIILPGSTSPVTFSSQSSSSMDASSSRVERFTNYSGTANVYKGPNGSTATVVTTDNGQQAIKVSTSSGTYYYNLSDSSSDTTTSTQYYGSTGYQIQSSPYTFAYQGPYGGSAESVTGPYGGTIGSATGPYGGTVGSVTGPYGGTVGSVTGPYGGTVGSVTGPYGNTVTGALQNNTYYDSLPSGIPRSQIPPGKEDLYILKSEVVPPVCPACPVSTACPRQEPCPPCPACARCPEPAFECKKVPNYNVINNEYLPAPVLNDFSQFGM